MGKRPKASEPTNAAPRVRTGQGQAHWCTSTQTHACAHNSARTPARPRLSSPTLPPAPAAPGPHTPHPAGPRAPRIPQPRRKALRVPLSMPALISPLPRPWHTKPASQKPGRPCVARPSPARLSSAQHRHFLQSLLSRGGPSHGRCRMQRGEGQAALGQSRRLEAAQLRSWAHVAPLCDRAVPKCEPAGKPQLGFAVPVLLFVLCVRTAGTSALWGSSQRSLP